MIILLIIINNFEIKAGPFDTGIITLLQPDRTEFTGRIWGDEFIYWAETEDGYRFVQSFDGWYYYATLNEHGEYISTVYKVGIDFPLAYSYQLERSQARLEEIQRRIQEFGEAVERSKEWYAQKQAEADAQGQPSVNLSIGIILIEFPDFPHFSGPNRPNGYFKTDFENMMFSENGIWYDIDPTNGTPHPENEAIFGSFKEYWYQMSKGKLRVGGKVVNPEDENGVPEWLVANDNRSVYIEFGPYDRLANEAIEKAIVSNWIDTIPGQPNYYDKLVVVFAGTVVVYPNLFTYTDPDQNYIQVAERSSLELWQNEDYSFTHIGVYAHEFGHNLGFKDEYAGAHPFLDDFGSWLEDGGTDTYNFDLMSWGIYNGPLRKGECPATLSPYYRISKNWISPIFINRDLDNFLVEYDFENPKVYRINPISAIEDEHLLFESRGREGFDKYLPWSPNDTINQPGRLIVWYHNMKWVYEPTGYTATDRSRIINADNTRHWFSQLTDFFPANFNPGIQDFNDISVPATTLGILIEDPSGNLGNYRPAHFALNGIQKLGNGNTLINEIRPNQATIKNEISGGWQTVSIGAILSDYTATSVFPTAIPPVYEYIPGHGYVVRNTLANGPGYWVKFGPAQSLIQAGLVLDSINIRVSRGWNLIGSISDKVPRLNICTEPPGIIITMYNYDGGYHYITDSDSLKPGVGYWLNSSSNGNIILLRNFNCPESEGINLFSMDKFTITDSDGRTQDLFVANIDIDTTLIGIDRSLPPPLPEIDFDARFNYGEFIKAVSVDSGEVNLEIDVETNAYPITLSWDLNPANGIEYSFMSDSGFGKISQIIDKKGNTIIGENSNGKIKLFGNVGNSLSSYLPEKFELLQNYPNPFNPSTVIEFSLPENVGNVRLSIYNVLGERVAELVNTSLVAGNYQYQWNASNVATGMYIYELRTDKFVAVKKMMLIK
jgi:hypothetical protein